MSKGVNPYGIITLVEVKIGDKNNFKRKKAIVKKEIIKDILKRNFTLFLLKEINFFHIQF